MATCQYCGTRNRADATYCNNCGGALTGTAAARAAGPPPSATQAHHATGRLPPHSRLAGRYHIVKPVGKGGMAAVYQAADVRTNRIIALKEMGQDGLTPEEVKEALDSFRFEADTLTRLRHPNLPRVYERFSEGSRHYLAMEFINGQTLEQRQQAHGGRALPEVEVMAWARQVCSVLTYLHSQKPPIIFRDLKPANIMVTTRGEIKLIDFGIARVFAPGGRAHDTQVLGTPGYAPPEQYGKAQTDPRADVYALGCTLYQLLTGYEPASTPFALPPMQTRNPAISPHIQRAIERATQLDRDARYPTVEAFARDLLQPAGLYYRSGECAHDAGELLALCRQLPRESAEHLHYGRIEAWMKTWGQKQLAAAAAAARAGTPDQAAALAAFVASAGKSRRGARGKAAPAPPAARVTAKHATAKAAARPTAKPAGATAPTAAASAAAPHAPGAVAVVQPRSVYFGRLVAGQRGSFSITISGQNGAHVAGQISAPVPWLAADPSHFDGASTLVRLTAETSKVTTPGIHQTNLRIASGGQYLYLPVTVDVVPAHIAAPARSAVAPGAKLPPVPPVWPNGKRPTPALARARRGGFLVALALALLLSAGALLGIPRALAHWAPALQLTQPLYIGLLVLSALGAMLGAIAGMGGAGWAGRMRTSLFSAGLGLVLAFALDGAHLFAARAGVIAGGRSALPGAVLLALALTAFGAALGADPWYSRLMLRTLAFIVRWSMFFLPLAGLLLGGWVGFRLLSGVLGSVFVPFGVLAGASVGAFLAARANRLVRRPRVPSAARIRP